MSRLGDYELEEEIGKGGMGRVFRARHVPTGAVRALKVVAGVNDPEAILRFRREAEALAAVGADTAVRVHEAGHEGGRTFYVMELLEGGSLAARIEKGALGWKDAVALAARIARAVARCHARGVIHRDLKPHNILFDERGEPRLVDFGCARDLAASTLTQTGTVLGTPGYMAPEQLDGRKADERSDVYALGVILHELVTGTRPHRGRTWRELLFEAQKGLVAPVAAAAGAPRALDRLLARALEPDPAKRLASASELVRELDALVTGASRGGPPWRVGAALALVLLVAGAVTLRLSRRGGESAAEPARAAVVSSTSPGEATKDRLERGELKAPELAALARTPDGTARLRGLVEEVTVLPLDVARDASALAKDSKELRLLVAVATLAASNDEATRGPAREAIASASRSGTLARFGDAVLAARKLHVEAAKRRLSIERGNIDDPGRLERVFKPLRDSPKLIAAATMEIEEDARIDVMANHRVGRLKPMADIMENTPVLLDVVDALPPHFLVARLTFLSNAQRQRFNEATAPVRVGYAQSAERVARALERGDELIAAHAFLLAVMLGDHYPGFTGVEEDEKRAAAILERHEKDDDDKGLFAIDRLRDLAKWRANDIAMTLEEEVDHSAALADGEAFAAEHVRYVARLRSIIEDRGSYEPVDFAGPGEAEHTQALFRLARGHDVGDLVLAREDLLAGASAFGLDKNEIESKARVVLDKKSEMPVYLVRSASCLLARCLRASGKESEADAVDQARKKIEKGEDLDMLEIYVAKKLIGH